MKILGRNIFKPIHLMPGDSIAVTWKCQTILCQHTVTAEQAMVMDEAVLIETIFEDRRALGGLVLEQKK